MTLKYSLYQAGDRRRERAQLGRQDALLLDPVDDVEGVLDPRPGLAQRRADVVAELLRRRTGAALATVDRNKIGSYSGFNHCLANRNKFAVFS